ncbi:hypothetical protein GCM10028820_03780 [Tessaracoccus terricola]
MHTTTDAYIRSTPLEEAVGWMHGLLPATPLPEETRTPRQALDDAIRPALLDAPCHVTFSGGRDSSAVLAAATALARREGHPLPIPVTRSYPDLPETQESEWQRSVIDHLGLKEWIRLDFTADETDLLGDVAREAVARRGVVWPAAVHTHGTMYQHLDGGSLMTGEGGDYVLGLRRSTPLTVLRRGRRPTGGLLKLAAVALLPRPARRLRSRRSTLSSKQSRWLTPEALRAHARATADESTLEPLRYDEATWFISRQRFLGVMAHNQAAEADVYGLRTLDPLIDHGFIAALARAGGGWGFNGRTATMRALFSDVLPDAVLSRTSKASFNNAYAGQFTREFAQTWDGTGVDPEYVDVEGLRRVWLSEQPTMATGMLLHSAWLASQGGQR